MNSFREKPVGWRGESYRHYLASKGFSTKVFGKDVRFKFVESPPSKQIGPTIHVETGKDPWVRVKVGDELEPVMRRPEEGFTPVTPETADKELVRKAVSEMEKRPVKRSVLSVLRDNIRIEDRRKPFVPVNKSKADEAVHVLEEKGLLDEDRRALLEAFEPGTANIAVVEKQLEGVDEPKIVRRPYAMVLGKPVYRIDTSDVTYRGEPDFTAMVLPVPEKKDKQFKERLAKEVAFADRQKAIKELEGLEQ